MANKVEKYPLRYIQNTAYQVEFPSGLFKNWFDIRHCINRRGKEIALKTYNEKNSQYYKDLITFLNSEILYDVSEYNEFLTSQRGNDLFGLFFIHELEDVSTYAKTGKIVTRRHCYSVPWGMDPAELISIIPSGYYSYVPSQYSQYKFNANGAILIAKMYRGSERKYQLNAKEYELLIGMIRISLLYELDRSQSGGLDIFVSNLQNNDFLGYAIKNKWLKR